MKITGLAFVWKDDLASEIQDVEEQHGVKVEIVQLNTEPDGWPLVSVEGDGTSVSEALWRKWGLAYSNVPSLDVVVEF